MDTSSYKPRPKWPLFLGGGVVLVLVLYFVLTSAPVVRALVLPKVAAALHSELVVGELSLSPFSSLTLRKVRITPTGAETLVTAEEVRLRYSLMAILGGTTQVDELTLDTPVVTVVGHPDGTSNLSKLLASLEQDQAAKPASAPGEPARLQVRNLAIKNGTLRQTLTATNGTMVAEISGLNATLDQVANGASSKLGLAAVMSATVSGTNQLAARLAGDLTFDLDPRLQPSRFGGNVDLTVTSASGAFRDFGKVAARLTADAAATELKQLRLALSESGRPVGELSVSGPLDLEKQEMRLNYELKGVDRTALGIVGAMAGVDFGQTSIAASGRVDLAQRGQVFASFGKLSVNQLTVSSASGTTPVLDTSFDYKVQVNLEEKSALIEKADLAVVQGGAAVVSGGLDRPMNIAWAGNAPGFREATYSLAVKDFDLAPWQAVGGTNLPTGRMNVTAKVTAERDGHRLTFALDSALDRLAMSAAGKSFRDLALRLKLGGTLDDFQVLRMEQLSGDFQQSGRTVAKYQAVLNFNQRSGEATGQASLDLMLPQLLALYPVDGVNLTSGEASVSAQLNIASGQTNGVFGAALKGLAGSVQGTPLRDYQVQLDTAGALTTDSVILRRGTLGLRSGAETGGSLEFSGDVNLKSQRSQFEFRTANLNEKVLGPLLAPALAPNELRSVSVDWNGKFQVDPKGESAIQSKLNVSRLVTRAPTSASPGKPMAFGMDLDAVGKGTVLDLRRLLVDLGPTARATNQLKATGKFDLGTNAPGPSSLVVTSDGLDFTEWYDLASAGGGASKAPESPAKPTSPAGGKPGEPIQFPLKEFTLDGRVAKLFLRDVAASNIVTQLAIRKGSVVQLKPFSLILNGAAVSANADLDLGVPGYTYDLDGSLQSVPIPPIAKSLMTGSYEDLKGTVSGSLKLKGAGVEGTDLKKHLVGTADFAATNLDYQVSALQTPLMKVLVGTLSTALKGPSLSSSPINFLGAQLEAGQGVVTVKTARVSSAAFTADVQGKVDLADVLTNSPIQLPVTVSLPKDGAMQVLPQFLTLKGTVGAPKSDIDPLALARAATQLPGAAGNLVNQGVSQLGNVIDKALGSGGGTNAGPASGLLKGLLSPGGGATNASTATNAATGGTNAPAATNAPAKPFNPLDLLRKRNP